LRKNVHNLIESDRSGGAIFSAKLARFGSLLFSANKLASSVKLAFA
jgi:hypothetical protein